jgi:hypothetical protein
MCSYITICYFRVECSKNRQIISYPSSAWGTFVFLIGYFHPFEEFLVYCARRWLNCVFSLFRKNSRDGAFAALAAGGVIYLEENHSSGYMLSALLAVWEFLHSPVLLAKIFLPCSTVMGVVSVRSRCWGVCHILTNFLWPITHHWFLVLPHPPYQVVTGYPTRSNRVSKKMIIDALSAFKVSIPRTSNSYDMGYEEQFHQVEDDGMDTVNILIISLIVMHDFCALILSSPTRYSCWIPTIICTWIPRDTRW